MIGWIDILTGLAVALAVLAIGLLFLVVVAFARRLLPRTKPVQLIPQKEIRKEERKKKKSHKYAAKRRTKSTQSKTKTK